MSQVGFFFQTLARDFHSLPPPYKIRGSLLRKAPMTGSLGITGRPGKNSTPRYYKHSKNIIYLSVHVVRHPGNIFRSVKKTNARNSCAIASANGPQRVRRIRLDLLLLCTSSTTTSTMDCGQPCVESVLACRPRVSEHTVAHWIAILDTFVL